MGFGWPVLLRANLMIKQFERVSVQTNGARLQGIAVPWPKHVNGNKWQWNVASWLFINTHVTN